MAINSLYLVRSGQSGWLDTHNTGISLYKEYLGAGTNTPNYKVHIANSGINPQLAVQDSAYWIGHPVSDPKTQIQMLDASGAALGFLKHDIGRFQLINVNTSGAIHLITEEGLAVLHPSGDFGVGVAEPKARIHVVQDSLRSGIPVAIFERSDRGQGRKSFRYTDEGQVGVNVDNPDYTLHVTGHLGLTGGAVGTVYSESYVYAQNESSIGSSGVSSYTIDFDSTTYRNITLTGSGVTTFGTSNPALINNEVKSVSVKLHADASGAKAVAFDNDIRFLGVKPTGLPADKVAVLAINSFGVGPTDTVAVWREEDEEIVGAQGPPGPVATGEAGNGFTNKIIGGDFDINPWQRGTVFDNLSPTWSGTLENPSGSLINEYTADRFAMLQSGSGISTKVYKTKDAPPVGGKSGIGFPVQYSLAVSQNSGTTFRDDGYLMLEYRLEGYDWRSLSHNNFNLSFFTKSNKTGTHAVCLRNSGNTESYVGTYDVYTSGSWEKKNLNIPKISPVYTGVPDFTGYSGWNYESEIGLKVGWVVAAGTGYNAPSANAWGTGNSLGFIGNYVEFCETGAIHCPTGVVGGDYFNITAIQLQKNHFFNPTYQARSVGQELDLCQRYYEQFDYASGETLGMGQAIGASVGRGVAFKFEETKRATPNLSSAGDFVASDSIWTAWDSVTGFTTGAASPFSVNLGFLTENGLLTQGAPSTIISNSGDGKIMIDSELY